MDDNISKYIVNHYGVDDEAAVRKLYKKGNFENNI